MRKFIRDVFHSKMGRAVRDQIDFRPTTFLYDYEEEYLASDLFVWRTDNGFKTIFNSSDILKKYYNISSTLKFVFFNNDGQFIKELQGDFDKSGMNSLLIDKQLMGTEGFGTFFVINAPNERGTQKLNVTNRCYIGYGKGDKFSMVHGNIVALMLNPSECDKPPHLSVKSAITPRKGNFTYVLQEKFDPDNSNTLCFTNPLDRTITISLNGGVTHLIKSKGCLFIELSKEQTSGVIEVKSDFYWPRPSVMVERNGFLDCHHC